MRLEPFDDFIHLRRLALLRYFDLTVHEHHLPVTVSWRPFLPLPPIRSSPPSPRLASSLLLITLDICLTCLTHNKANPEVVCVSSRVRTPSSGVSALELFTEAFPTILKLIVPNKSKKSNNNFDLHSLHHRGASKPTPSCLDVKAVFVASLHFQSEVIANLFPSPRLPVRRAMRP